VQHNEITSERVLEEKTFSSFRKAVGEGNPGIGASGVAGKRFSGPVSLKMLEDFGFAAFYRAA
jgi:hypothetical protein